MLFAKLVGFTAHLYFGASSETRTAKPSKYEGGLLISNVASVAATCCHTKDSEESQSRIKGCALERGF